MPKLTLTLDSTQISDILKCPHMWSLAHREHLRKTDVVTTLLDEGALVHAVLDAYYTFKTVFESSHDNFKIMKVVLLVFTDNGLFTHYGVSVDRWKFLYERILQYLFKNSNNDFQPIISSDRPGVEIGFSKVLYEDAKYLFIVEGRIDLIITISEIPAWVDHKTQSTSRRLYPFKPQFLTYAWATGYSKAIINYIRLHQTYNEKDTLVKDVIDFPKFIIDEWEETMLKKVFFPLAYVLESEGINCNSDAFDKNRGACSGAFDSNPCMFTQICETQSSEMKENIKNFAYTQIKPWRPWN